MASPRVVLIMGGEGRGKLPWNAWPALRRELHQHGRGGVPTAGWPWAE